MNLAQIQTDSELLVSDVAAAELIEIAEELTNAHAVLRADLADTGANIVDIFRGVADDFSLGDTWTGLRVVVEGVVVFLTNTVELFRTVHIGTEVSVVDFIDVAFVHVAAEDRFSNMVRHVDLQQVEHAEELLLGDMAVACAIEVLELGLEVDTAGVDSPLELAEDIVHLLFSAGARVLQVLASR